VGGEGEVATCVLQHSVKCQDFFSFVSATNTCFTFVNGVDALLFFISSIMAYTNKAFKYFRSNTT
jgi:hypothetical protein